MEKKKNLKHYLIGLILIVLGIIFTNCSTIEWRKLELVPNEAPNSKIHNLAVLIEGEPETRKQISAFMRNYFDSSKEEMGYCTIDLTYRFESNGAGVGLFIFSLFTVYVPNLIGIPFWGDVYRLYATLHIFDSRGDLVQTFQDVNRFTIYNGLYYGGSSQTTKKAGKYYSELLANLLNQVNKDSRMINATLEAAGPITIENSSTARSKIRGTVITTR